MSGECEKRGECRCQNDFIYEPIYLKRPDGSIMHAFRMVDHVEIKDEYCKTCKNELVACVCMGDE